MPGLQRTKENIETFQTEVIHKERRHEYSPNSDYRERNNVETLHI